MTRCNPWANWITIFLLLGWTASAHEPGADFSEHPHRGHRWVRSHPFTLLGMVRNDPAPCNLEQYRGAGFDTILAWEPGTYDELLPRVAADAMPYHVHLEKWGAEEAGGPDTTEEMLGKAVRSLDSEENRAAIERITRHPGCIGFIVNDEISRPMHLRYTRHLLAWLRELHPDVLAYSNAHPAGHEGVPGYGDSLDRYLDEFAAMMAPDVLMTDVYPLSYPDGTSHDYFKLLAAVRKAALANGMPYWMFIQSFETHGGWDRRLPSESDLRFQMFAPLTYGYTGILYFTYDMGFERGLIEKTGEPNSLYHAAVRANPEVANVGAAMRFLTSTDVRYVPGAHEVDGKTVANALPRDAKAWRPDKGDTRIKNVVIGDPGEGNDALIGFFRDDFGEPYFMITNLRHGAEITAAAGVLEITIEFAPDIRALYRLDRETGASVPVRLQEGVLRTTLPGGTGDLYKFSQGPFPGA